MTSYINHPLLKKDAIESRLYQQILAGDVLKKGNTMVVAPTALGKTIIAILLVIISLLAVVGSYIFTDRQEVAVAPVRHEKNPSDTEKSQKETRQKERQKEREYVVAAVTSFRDNEEALAALAAAINSGSYSQGILLDRASSTIQKVNTSRAGLQKKADGTNADLSREINELLDIEVKRAECMRQGLQGDTDQYRVGGEYYDQFQVRFEALKGHYGLQE